MIFACAISPGCTQAPETDNGSVIWRILYGRIQYGRRRLCQGQLDRIKAALAMRGPDPASSPRLLDWNMDRTCPALHTAPRLAKKIVLRACQASQCRSSHAAWHRADPHPMATCMQRVRILPIPLATSALHCPHDHASMAAMKNKNPAVAGFCQQHRWLSAACRSASDHAQGSRRTMVWSRSGPVETIEIGQPASSSSARR